MATNYAAFDHLIEGAQVIDGDYRYVYVNEAVAAQGRTTVEALTGRKMQECYPGIEQTEIYRLIGEVAKAREPRSLINEFDFPDGEKGYFQLRLQPVEEGVLVMSFDITAQVRAKRTLEAVNEELEQRVAERTAQLEEKNEELAQLVFMASHDLQGPLRTILGLLDVLQEDVLPERIRPSVGFIAREAVRMRDVVHDVVAFSALEPTGATESIDARRVVHDVVEELSNAIREAGAEVEVGALPTVQVDERALHTLFFGLLSNAIKFRRLDEPPHVRVDALREDARWVFSVADDGIGFDMQYCERVFTMFQRLHKKTVYEGTGIGLALCRKIVAMHGGEIWVKSSPGSGATFYFSLPV
ncbi:MAG: ATP-binding protein [Deltaproteobacteria bacterium]|jgi:light-regulated signal transduction histidine kinase (bacteriophytochrome)